MKEGVLVGVVEYTYWSDDALRGIFVVVVVAMMTVIISKQTYTHLHACVHTCGYGCTHLI